jgi:hypothetical protein
MSTSTSTVRASTSVLTTPSAVPPRTPHGERAHFTDRARAKTLTAFEGDIS